MNGEVSVVIPCFNEEESLPGMFAAIGSLLARDGGRRYEFIFVDDGSTDRTGDLLTAFCSAHGQASAVRQPNQGIAAAVEAGAGRARYAVTASIDADGSYDLGELPALLDRLRGDVEMVVASPYHPAGRVEGVPPWRLALSRTLSSLYRGVLNNKLHTYTACFRAWKSSALPKLAPGSGGFLGILETLVDIDLAGGRIEEYPTTLRVRRFGRSKMKILPVGFQHLRFFLLVCLRGLLPRRVVRRGAV